jgi:hypothetical protein
MLPFGELALWVSLLCVVYITLLQADSAIFFSVT